MKLCVTNKRPCHLRRGDLRCVPQHTPSLLLGYHVCCPRCGFVTLALQLDEGRLISKHDGGAEVTFSQPLRCVYCAVLIHLAAGTAILEEDARVRRVEFR